MSIVTAMHIQGQVAVVYRAPIVSLQLLLQHMTTLIHHVTIENKATVVMGDFNDDVLSTSSSRVEQFMLSQGYTQLVRQSTTDRATLIDHMYFSEDDVAVQVRDVYYSEAVYCSVPLSVLY